MTTHGTLHLVAVLLTAGAVVVQGALLSGRRRRGAALGLVAAVLMLVAMVDAAYVGLVSPIAWTALLVVAGVGFAAARSSRRRIVVAGGGAESVGVTTHDALGLVAMAALIPLMAGDVATGDAGAHAGHGMGAGLLTVVVLAVAIGHVIGAGAAFARTPGLGPRLSCTLMGGATAFMAAAVLT